MPHATANGIRIEYDTFGDASSPALLLIAGNGAQLLFWEPEFCELLVQQGFFVIRFDNRDAGLSTKFDEAGTPDLMAVIQAAMQGQPMEPPYTLADMADDAVGLLDALGIEKAHVCGASMGGMIAQIVACRHPEHVLSMVSIMSSTGNPEVMQGKPEALAAVLTPPPDERQAYVEHNLNVWRKIWSPGFPFEEERARGFLEQSHDRSYCPQGAVRQNVAVIAGGDRRPALALLAVPTLVVHGSGDPLMPLASGQDTARTIPGARLLVIEGMGHDMPTGTWETMATAMAELAKQATA